jgi:hypothetical protein
MWLVDEIRQQTILFHQIIRPEQSFAEYWVRFEKSCARWNGEKVKMFDRLKCFKNFVGLLRHSPERQWK